jgi:cell division protein FtsQ
MPRLIAPLRRPQRRRWARRGLLTPRRVAVAAVALAALATTVAAVHFVDRHGIVTRIADAIDDTKVAAMRWTAQAGLYVNEIQLEGRVETLAGDIIAALDVRRGEPMLSFNPQQAKAEIERLPWIKTAQVERRFPGTIYVHIAEREALSLWQRQARLAVIDRDGKEIKGAAIERFAHLPIVVGEDAPRHARPLLALLATEPELERRVTHAIRVAGRRWNLLLDNGIEVQMPEVDLGAAWAKLASTERANRVLQRNVVTIDLRLPDRLIVRTGPEALPPVPTPLPAPSPRGRNPRTT